MAFYCILESLKIKIFCDTQPWWALLGQGIGRDRELGGTRDWEEQGIGRNKGEEQGIERNKGLGRTGRGRVRNMLDNIWFQSLYVKYTYEIQGISN